MRPILSFIGILFICSCNSGNTDANDPARPASTVVDTEKKEITRTIRFNAFDTTVKVLFRNTTDTISDIQQKNMDDFIARQYQLAPEIFKKIFEFYKESYPAYKKGWETDKSLQGEDIEEDLPTPTTAEKLRSFYFPATIYIQSKKNCKEGTFGIEFDCNWDIKSGLGVAIKDWKVISAGVAEISYVN